MAKPLEARHKAFERELRARIDAFCRLPGVPQAARKAARWLIHPGWSAGADPPQPFPDVPELGERLLQAWRQVAGQELSAWLDATQAIACPPPEPLGAATLLSQVNGGEIERAPESIVPRRLQLAALSSESLTARALIPPVTGRAYGGLWNELMEQASRLPPPEAGLCTWLDAFDSMLGIVLHAVPARAKGNGDPTDTLIDLVRLSAACGIALADHTVATVGDDRRTDPYRLVLGEFTPIQDFILGTDPASPWPAHALACGRSAFVKIASEVGAHAVLQRLGLPALCKVFGGASKFMLLVPNTRNVEAQLGALRREFQRWSLNELAGSGELVLAWWMVPAEAVVQQPSPGRKNPRDTFASRYRQLLHLLEAAKLHRFNLLNNAEPVLHGFLDAVAAGAGLCSVDGACVGAPAPEVLLQAYRPPTARPPALSRAAAFQLDLPLRLGSAATLVLDGRPVPGDPRLRFLGWWVGFDDDAPWAHPRWDISFGLRTARDQTFQGLPVRFIAQAMGRAPSGQLAMLKGDVDRLGRVFGQGIPRFSMTRLAQVSRELELFFAVVVPPLLKQHAPDVQTVVAGGDDFTFIGPPAQIVALADRLQAAWVAYTGNPSLSVSMGVHIAARGETLRDVDRRSDEALSRAKVARGSLDVHGRSVSWTRREHLRDLECRLREGLAALTASIRADAARALQVRLLQRLLAVSTAMDDPREYTGLRWRALLHSALSEFSSRVAMAPGSCRTHREAFTLLEPLIDRQGFEAFGRDIRIVLTNLSLDLRDQPMNEPVIAPAWDALAAPAESGAAYLDRLPSVALDDVLDGIDLDHPSEVLFGEQAMALAGALDDASRTPVFDLLQRLREWDGYCGRLDDRFMLLRPQIALHASRERPSETALAAILRQRVMRAATNAEQLHCARWLLETAVVFHGIHRALTRPTTDPA